LNKITEKISLLFREKEHRLGELLVDAFLSETHHLSAKASEHPVESGTNIVDHIQIQPLTLDIKGIISNTPMGLIGLTAFKSAQNYFNNQSNDLAAAAFKKLEDIFAKQEPITIATSLKDYPNMVLESLIIEREGQTSASLHFSCTARQIRMVNQKLVEIPKPKNSRSKTKKKQELQETKEISAQQAEAIEKDNSFIFSGLKKIVGG
jgi:hypothetical protein